MNPYADVHVALTAKRVIVESLNKRFRLLNPIRVQINAVEEARNRRRREPNVSGTSGGQHAQAVFSDCAAHLRQGLGSSQEKCTANETSGGTDWRCSEGSSSPRVGTTKPPHGPSQFQDGSGVVVGAKLLLHTPRGQHAKCLLTPFSLSLSEYLLHLSTMFALAFLCLFVSFLLSLCLGASGVLRVCWSVRVSACVSTSPPPPRDLYFSSRHKRIQFS